MPTVIFIFCKFSYITPSNSKQWDELSATLGQIAKSMQVITAEVKNIKQTQDKNRGNFPSVRVLCTPFLRHTIFTHHMNRYGVWICWPRCAHDEPEPVETKIEGEFIKSLKLRPQFEMLLICINYVFKRSNFKVARTWLKPVSIYSTDHTEPEKV